MYKKLLTLSFAVLYVTAILAQTIEVGSYNIRYRNNEDSLSGNSWERRCPIICQLIGWENPEIIGLQEVLHSQLQDLRQNLPSYDYIGVGRDDGSTRGEYAPIFYRTDELRLDTCGYFWLSQTPERPSLGWDAACVRICTWGLFAKLGTAKHILVMNLHMDHVGKVARREAAHLIINRLKQLRSSLAKCKYGQDFDLPVIVTGDFNVDQHDEIYSIFTGALIDSYECAKSRFATNGTFHGFHPQRYTDSRIDHILVTSDLDVEAYCVRTDSYWTPDNLTTDDGLHSKQAFVRRLPSDHYPVFARIKLR